MALSIILYLLFEPPKQIFCKPVIAYGRPLNLSRCDDNSTKKEKESKFFDNPNIFIFVFVKKILNQIIKLCILKNYYKKKIP